ncbi:MAG: hypothetical protein ABI663_14695 [Chryseolinea sp.]
MTINSEIVKEIILLCEIMFEGRNNGTITQATYSEKFKPFLTKFKDKFGESPNLFLQNELKIFYDGHLEKLNANFDYKSFGFWGRTIYNYTWSCVYYDLAKDAIPASYSPQLYIVVNKFGIKFGFCYGNYVDDNDEMVKLALSGSHFLLLKKCFETDRELKFFNSAKEEITASPEKLFGKDERIIVKTEDDIINNWSSSSLLIKEFDRENIPDDIGNVIQSTLLNLKEVFVSILPLNNHKMESPKIKSVHNLPLDISKLKADATLSGLHISSATIDRFVTSLIAKPFLILTGLSGSGKTKLAQAFAKWICENKDQYCIVPVGADWTGREPLLGFPNALEHGKYVKPDNGVLDLILRADQNQGKPYFLILDEMNLSHVERYFADFLSSMESGEPIPLHHGEMEWNDVPSHITLPKNLFIVGTVNIDETTYMFSPKVLDRANVIEFRVTEEEMRDYLEQAKSLKLDELNGLGSDMATSFVELARDKSLSPADPSLLGSELLKFFIELKKTGAEFGYRSAAEINRLTAVINKLEPNWSIQQIIDVVIMQKLLPKVHGSRKKLEDSLKALGRLCVTEQSIFEEYIKNGSTDINKIKYPISLEKISRMYKALHHNGFTSYAEA